MNLLIKMIILSLIGYFISCVVTFFKEPPLPDLKEEWWGPEPIKVDTSIIKFEIDVPDKVIVDLKTRLNNTKPLTPSLHGAIQEYGLNMYALKAILNYWLNEYNWPERQKYLNQFPQFKTNIQGLNIHYVHVKPKPSNNEPVLPLLILHGWPGSVREFYKIIPTLTRVHKQYGFKFEVIAPSIPGFGFSDGAIKPGFGAVAMAIVMKNLMLRLGHEKFYVQGGDWGAVAATNMATLFPQHLLGLHTNMPTPLGKISFLKVLIGRLWPSLAMDEERKHKLYPFTPVISELLEESGYFHLQATKPDTIGVAINDSPAGMAAYFLEKLSIGTRRKYRHRKDAGLLQSYTYDELLDNLMYYWIPGTMTTCSRLYAESFSVREFNLGLFNIPISMEVPCAIARYPDEIFYHPEWILRDKYPNLVYVSDFKEGGHFPAFELPEIFVEDLFLAVHKMRQLKK